MAKFSLSRIGVCSHIFLPPLAAVRLTTNGGCCCERYSGLLLQWRIRLRCCHGGRKSGSMCKGGARAGVAVEMMVVVLHLQWLWW